MKHSKEAGSQLQHGLDRYALRPRLPLPRAGVKFVHDDRLKARFKDGHIGSYGSGSLYARMWITWTGSGMATMAAIAHELIRKHREYWKGGEPTIAFVYERLAMPFQGDVLSMMIGEEGTPFDPTWFQYWLNAAWAEYYRQDVSPAHQLSSVGWIVQPPYDPEATPTWILQGIGPTQPDQLVEAAHNLGFLLLHEGVAIIPPEGSDLPTILHTNGGENLVEHPQFGEVPGGLDYIPLGEWHGESHAFTKEDIDTFPQTVGSGSGTHRGPFFVY